MATRRESIAPDWYTKPPFAYSPAVRFGSWIYPSQLFAADYGSGLDADARLPYQSSDTAPQYRAVLRRLARLVEPLGASINHQVKVDNYFSSRRHHGSREVRREVGLLGAASMALHARRLLVPGAVVSLDPVLVAGDSPPVERLQTDAVPLPVAGYAQAVRYGDWVFLAGDLATDFQHALAPEAEVDTRAWFQDPIEVQTRYTLQKLDVIFRHAGSSLQDMVYARVALVDPDDVAGLDRVWREIWPENPPARNVVFTCGLASEEARIEILPIGLVSGSKLPREEIRTSNAPRPLFHEPQALRVGDLLFLSTQMAVDEQGLDPRVPADPSFPFFGSTTKRQMDVILRNVKALCEAGGASLDTVLRTQLQFTDLAEFDAAREAWEGCFGPQPPALSAAEVPGPLPVPGCSVLMDVVAGVVE